MENKKQPSWTVSDVFALFKGERNPESKVKFYLYALGILATPITLGGALFGYITAYKRKLYHLDLPPTLAPLHPFARLAMIICAFGIWACLIGAIVFLAVVAAILDSDRDFGAFVIVIFGFMLLNAAITFVIMFSFEQWRGRMYALRTNLNKFGSAKWATDNDLAEFVGQNGIYIGGGYTFPKQGHLMSVAGTRSGKFTNLIAPNLLGLGGYEGSWFVIDPKGETAFVTARYQRESGKEVRVIDPWKVYSETPDTFNPLDVIPLDDIEAIADDAAMIAEMIVPQHSGSSDPYWDNRSRSIISALIMHCVLEYKNALLQKEENDQEQGFKIEGNEIENTKTLATVWRWLRLPEDEFKGLLGEMAASDNEIVSLAANEAQSTLNNSPKTHGSVMSNCFTHTDFLKSPSLQTSISKSNFDINKITEGNAALYVIIPPDKIDSQSKWLRILVATALRTVVRNRNKRVTFVLDEFPSLGKINDVSSFMAMGAGYNITLWPIFQSLSQLKQIYGDGWEVFMAGASVKHFFGVNDSFTANHISGLAGNSTYVVYDRNVIGNDKGQPSARPLITPDEVRRGSADKIFTFIEQKPISDFQKYPYYDMPRTNERADPNPYYVPN